MINLNAQMTVNEGLIHIMRILCRSTIPEAESPDMIAIVAFLARSQQHVQNCERILADADRLLSIEGHGTKQRAHDLIKKHLSDYKPHWWFMRSFDRDAWILRVEGFALIVERYDRAYPIKLDQYERTVFDGFSEVGAHFRAYRFQLENAKSTDEFESVITGKDQR